MIEVLVFLDPPQGQECGSLKFFSVRAEDFMVDTVVDHVYPGAVDLELLLDLMLRALRESDEPIVGGFDRPLCELYNGPQGNSELHCGDGLVNMMNHSDHRGLCYEAGPPWNCVGNIINDNIRIRRESSNKDWSFQMYSESSSPSENLESVNHFFPLGSRE